MSTTMSKARPVIKVFRAIKSWSTLACMQKCSKSQNCVIYKFRKSKSRCLLMKIELVKSKKGTGVTGIIPCKTTETTTTTLTTTTPTTTTSTTTTSTTTTPPPVECSQYLTLDDSTRNVDYTATTDYCDKSSNSAKSPDWAGPGWYRFESPGGVMMPETPPPSGSCNTDNPAWLNGTHPQHIGQTTNNFVCFVWYSLTCSNPTDIKVTKCSDFYVYYLPDTFYCNDRYCGTN